MVTSLNWKSDALDQRRALSVSTGLLLLRNIWLTNFANCYMHQWEALLPFKAFSRLITIVFIVPRNVTLFLLLILQWYHSDEYNSHLFLWKHTEHVWEMSLCCSGYYPQTSWEHKKHLKHCYTGVCFSLQYCFSFLSNICSRCSNCIELKKLME